METDRIDLDKQIYEKNQNYVKKKTILIAVDKEASQIKWRRTERTKNTYV